MSVPISGTDKLASFGDSITAGFNMGGIGWASNTLCLFERLRAALPGLSTWAGGVASLKVADSYVNVPALVAQHPTHVIVELATNDWIRSVFNGDPLYNPTQVCADLTTLYGMIRAGLPGVVLLQVSLFSIDEKFPDPYEDPVNGFSVWNAAIAANCTTSGVTYIDVRTPQQAYEQANNVPPPGAANGLLTSDGIHPKLIGQQLMSAAALTVFSYVSPGNQVGPIADAFGDPIFPAAPRVNSPDSVAAAGAIGSGIPKWGGRIPDGATATISIAAGSRYSLPVLTQNIVVTVATGGAPLTGEMIMVDVVRTSAFTVTFVDDAASGLLVVLASQKMTVMATFNGTHFANARSVRIQ